jgi:Family of unknown function (DUF6328)
MSDSGGVATARRAEDDERGESELHRADRNMLELLQELRVAQIGVQILFAGLIGVSFMDRFEDVNAFQRWTYVVTLLLAAVTTGLLVAPAAAHRMTFGRGVKPQTVQLGHRLFVWGLAMLALSFAGAVLLVLDFTVGRVFGVVAAAAVAVLLLVLWFVVPLPVRSEGDKGEGARNRSAGDEGADTPGA